MSNKRMMDGISPLKGRLDMTFRDKNTGDIVEEHGDNLVVNVGMEQILRSFTTAVPSGGSLMYVLQSFRIGNDVGTGTELSPGPAQPSYTAASQSVVHSEDYSNINIVYPNYYTVEMNLVLDGNTVMAAYPSEVDLRFSSAALYSGNSEIFAYRRFQTRTITREIVVDVKWTIYFDGQGGI